MMRITVSGATGLIGTKLVAALRVGGRRSDCALTPAEDARRMLGVDPVGWHPETEPAPVDALAGRDGVVHLAGEPIAQRWTQGSKEHTRSSREFGTKRLIQGLERSAPRPWFPHCIRGRLLRRTRRRASGRRRTTRHGLPCKRVRAWEHSAIAAAGLGMRTVTLRTGVLLDRADGALTRMLPSRFGVGGLVAGGHQYISRIAPDDLVRMYLAALNDQDWSGPFNATAPEPVTNRAFAHALGRVLHRPALLPIPAFALRALYGEMASVVTTGQRALQVRALERGFEFRHGGALLAARSHAKSP